MTSDAEQLPAATPYRARLRAVMDEMGCVPRLWLVRLLIRITLMTLCVWHRPDIDNRAET